MNRLAWTIVMALAAYGLSGCGSDDTAKGGTGGAGGTSGSGTGATSGNGTSGGTGATSGNGSGASGASAGGGSSCTTASQCLNSQVCDPATQTCVAYQCNDTKACPSGQVCIAQTDGARGGACYEKCTPFTSSCSGDRECYSLTYDNTDGICLDRGPAGACNANFESLVATGCEAGQICAQGIYGGECLQQCDFFSTSPGCPTGTRCSVDGYCFAGAADSAAVGSACSASAKSQDFCGASNTHLGGLCLTPPGGSLTCMQFCRTDQKDCGGGSNYCSPISDTNPELGVCIDLGTCGSGGTGTCDECIKAAVATDGCCSAVSANCSNTVACSALLSCIQACATDDNTCLDNCAGQNPNGIAPLNDLFSCIYGDDNQGFKGGCGTVCTMMSDMSMMMP